MKRIIITGDAGRGKSTLASKISNKLGVPHFSTDDFFYEVKFSKIRPREDALRKISEIYEQETWIVEGTTAWLLQPGMDKADKIIYLKYKNILNQWMVLFRRYLSRKEETLKGLFQLCKHVFYKRYGLGYKKDKPTHLDFISPYKDKVVTLSSFGEIENFEKSLK